MTRSIFRAAGLALALAGVQAASAQVVVEGAWARPTVAGQNAGGGYLSIRSAQDDRLLGGSTPLAERVELHSMSMKGDVMQMRQLEAIAVPGGGRVDLKPGGLHLMFMGLKQPLAAGTKVPVTLKFEKSGEVKTEFVVGPQRPTSTKP